MSINCVLQSPCPLRFDRTLCSASAIVRYICKPLSSLLQCHGIRTRASQLWKRSSHTGMVSLTDRWPRQNTKNLNMEACGLTREEGKRDENEATCSNSVTNFFLVSSKQGVKTSRARLGNVLASKLHADKELRMQKSENAFASRIFNTAATNREVVPRLCTTGAVMKKSQLM